MPLSAFCNLVALAFPYFCKQKHEYDDFNELQDILMFHIIKGEYHAYGILDYNVRYVETLQESEGADVEMSLCLQYGAAHAAARDDVDRLLIMKGCGASEVVTAIQSNLIMDNGPAHVLDKICVYQK